MRLCLLLCFVITGVFLYDETCAQPAVAPVGISFNRMHQLGKEPDAWPHLRQHLGWLQFPINEVAFLAPAEDIKGILHAIDGTDIKIAVECGYFDWDSHNEEFTAANPRRITDRPRDPVTTGVGRMTARSEIAKLGYLTRQGRAPDFLVLDGPVRRLIHPGADVGREDIAGMDRIDDAIREVLDYMRHMRDAFPDVHFVAITNFPNYAWKHWPAYTADRQGWGDYAPIVRQLVQRAQAAGMPFAAIRADTPYEYLQGTVPIAGQPWNPAQVKWWDRLFDLSNTVDRLGLDFQITINSSFGGDASDRGFALRSLKCLDEFRRRGGQADFYMLHSWYKYPRRAIPESEPWTLAFAGNRFLDALQSPPGTVLEQLESTGDWQRGDSHFDLTEPTTPGGNSHPDGYDNGNWSYWSISSPSPFSKKPPTAELEYEPMQWSAETGSSVGYRGKSSAQHTSIKADHVERTEFVPQVEFTPVLRWTCVRPGCYSFQGNWWMSRAGNVNLGFELKSETQQRCLDFQSRHVDAQPFHTTMEMQPGDTAEWWVEANGDASYDTTRLRLRITREPK